MDLLKFLSGSKDTPGGCDHTRLKLQRRQLPKPNLKVGLPGVGPALSFTKKQPDYQYYCPACRKDLPLNQNSRWENLFSSYRPPAQPRPQAVPPRANPKPSAPGNRTNPGAGGKTGGYVREPIRAKLRYDILTRDKFRCVKCGAKQDERTQLHVDHIKPVSRGGTNDPSNLQTLCARCNLGKGARLG
jgi:hypothetical protein